MRKGALRNIMVLDMTRVLAGPYCGMILADMGAEVIKIEVPGKGDDSRAFTPWVNGESAYYMNLNRNKTGITLNLKEEKGKAIFLELVKKADILIENFRPGTMEKLGLGYDELKKVNQKLVYGCVSGFGHYGPYKDRAGYDIIAQAMAGLMSTTGWPEGGPTRTGTAIADVLAGLNMTIGVLAAYISKKEDQVGQKVDVALTDSVVSALEIITQIYLVTGENPKRIGNRYESTYPYDSFETKDGTLVIGCGNDKLFNLLSVLMGSPELSSDERFCKNTLRVKNNKELKAIIEEWLKDKTVEGAVALMLERGIPAAPINTIDKVVSDEHIAKAREMFVEVDHPVAGKLKLTGCHIKMSKTQPQIRKPAPILGQHTDEVLKKYLGSTEKELQELKEKGIL